MAVGGAVVGPVVVGDGAVATLSISIDVEPVTVPALPSASPRGATSATPASPTVPVRPSTGREKSPRDPDVSEIPPGLHSPDGNGTAALYAAGGFGISCAASVLWETA
jgi:hypothetical protein